MPSRRRGVRGTSRGDVPVGGERCARTRETLRRAALGPQRHDRPIHRPRAGAGARATGERASGVTLRVICVGAGWATTHRHIPALQRDPRAQIIGIVDTHADRARAVAQRHRLPYWGADLDAPWVREADCATVGTPPGSHRAVVTAL